VPDWVVVLAGILVLVAAILAVDWFTAGHSRRRLVRARDQQVGNTNVDYTVLQRQGVSQQEQTWTNP
jgi:hypothetical protein